MQYRLHWLLYLSELPIAQTLNREAETRSVSLFVIPAQAGIQGFLPGFRVSLHSPGMTGYLAYQGQVKCFLSGWFH
jgi:hypothetical protein